MTNPPALTYRFRIKDKHDSELRRQSRAVNFVWNFCRETQQNAQRWDKKWPSGFDLIKLTAGTCKDLNLNSQTIQQVCRQYATSRGRRGQPLLRWRGRKSLGWVPFRDGDVHFDGECFVFRSERYHAWVSRDIEKGAIFRAGSFSQDAQGHWCINLPLDVECEPSSGKDAIGIDLGLKNMAVLSTGRAIEHPRWYRKMESRIATAQRARKKKQFRKLHAKVKAQRADHLHKESLRIVQEHGAVFVGNVRPSTIAKTRMGKSSMDAGWAIFKHHLEYKANARGVLFAEVNEAYTTQTCSQCGSIEGPKGVAGLGIRGWRCSCGADHDRDTNAAQNILARGLASLVEGAVS